MGRRGFYIEVPRLEKHGVSRVTDPTGDKLLLYFSFLEVVHINMNAIYWGV